MNQRFLGCRSRRRRCDGHYHPPFLVAVIIGRLTIDGCLVTDIEVLAGPEVVRCGDHSGRELVQQELFVGCGESELLWGREHGGLAVAKPNAVAALAMVRVRLRVVCTVGVGALMSYDPRDAKPLMSRVRRVGGLSCSPEVHVAADRKWPP